jgi:hypothetical protein
MMLNTAGAGIHPERYRDVVADGRLGWGTDWRSAMGPLLVAVSGCVLLCRRAGRRIRGGGRGEIAR